MFFFMFLGSQVITDMNFWKLCEKTFDCAAQNSDFDPVHHLQVTLNLDL